MDRLLILFVNGLLVDEKENIKSLFLKNIYKLVVLQMQDELNLTGKCRQEFYFYLNVLDAQVLRYIVVKPAVQTTEP